MPDDKEKTVPIDTSGPDATVDIEEVKDESVVETEAPKEETSTTEQEPVKQETEEKKQDENLEDYSKGCLLYTSPSPRDKRQSRMPSSA